MTTPPTSPAGASEPAGAAAPSGGGTAPTDAGLAAARTPVASVSASASAPAGAAAAAPYVAATETLRTTVRWLVTAAAGVGGVLVAGLQLKGLGALGTNELTRLAVVFASLAAALVAVGYMILRASQILTDEWVTLADLHSERFDRRLRHDSRSHRDRTLRTTRDRVREHVRRIRNRRDRQRSAVITALYERLELIKEELFGSLAADISDLYARLMEANEATRLDPNSPCAVTAAALQQAASAVVAFANFYITRESFKTLRRQLAGASTVVVLGVLVFAYAANPAKPSSSTEKPASVNSSPTPSPAPKPGSTPPSAPPSGR